MKIAFYVMNRTVSEKNVTVRNTLHSIINDRKISRLSTFVCFVDMRKAFDTVQRNLLWYKLSKAGVRGKFLSALQSLYDNVSCTVRVNDQFTPWFKVNAGVKQGCLIYPSLFAFYIFYYTQMTLRL